MGRSSSSNFALALTLQLVRGVAGLAAIAAAYWIWSARIPASAAIGLLLVVAALIAWRGCPTCWLAGLVGVIGSRGQGCPLPSRHSARRTPPKGKERALADPPFPFAP